MADDPKPASAAELAALTLRVSKLENAKAPPDFAVQLAAARKRLEVLEEVAGPATPFPWRHRFNNKLLVRIIGQGTETTFEAEGGEVMTVPTHEFNAQFEDSTAA